MLLPLFFTVLILWLILVKWRNLLTHLPLTLAGVLAAALALFNNLAGHFLAPMGILLTPAVVLMAAWLILSARTGSSLLKVALLALIIIGHDVGIKLYAGGQHDSEGQGWMIAFLFMGLLPTYGLLLYHLSRPGPEPRSRRVLSGLLFPLLLLGYLYCFSNLGIGRSY